MPNPANAPTCDRTASPSQPQPSHPPAQQRQRGLVVWWFYRRMVAPERFRGAPPQYQFTIPSPTPRPVHRCALRTQGAHGPPSLAMTLGSPLLRSGRDDDRFEGRRLHHWKVGWLLALKDAAGIEAGLAIGPGQARSVTHQTTGRDQFPKWIDRGNAMTRCQCGQLLAHRNRFASSVCSGNLSEAEHAAASGSGYRHIKHNADRCGPRATMRPAFAG